MPLRMLLTIAGAGLVALAVWMGRQCSLAVYPCRCAICGHEWTDYEIHHNQWPIFTYDGGSQHAPDHEVIYERGGHR